MAVAAQAESCCVYVKPKKIMPPMHGNILFGYWALPMAHLLILKSSMLFISWLLSQGVIRHDRVVIGDAL